jgi:hypothetical protein
MTHKLRSQVIAGRTTVYGSEEMGRIRFPSENRTHTCRVTRTQDRYGFDGRTNATDEYTCWRIGLEWVELVECPLATRTGCSLDRVPLASEAREFRSCWHRDISG